MSNVLSSLKKKTKHYLDADLDKVGYLSLYRSSTANDDGNYLAYFLDGDTKQYLYGEDVMDFIDYCYYVGALTIDGAKVIANQSVSVGPPSFKIIGSIYITYDAASKAFVGTYIPVEKPTTT